MRHDSLDVLLRQHRCERIGDASPIYAPKSDVFTGKWTVRLIQSSLAIETCQPAKTVQAALTAERVPPSVWQDSHECANIQDSAYFAKVCAQIVQLRKELAAARDYEQLSLRAAELRKGLEEAPIVATADPLPAFVQQRLKRAHGMSLAAKELRAVYEAWCATDGYEPLSPPKFAAELKTLGCDKWKSRGLMRYRDLQLVA